mgnify:CR=1 FL=1
MKADTKGRAKPSVMINYALFRMPLYFMCSR